MESKKDILNPICTSCGEPIPKHERPEFSEDCECISCEMKFRDSADIDNFGS